MLIRALEVNDVAEFSWEKLYMRKNFRWQHRKFKILV